jgi:hypothetical protein
MIGREHLIALQCKAAILSESDKCTNEDGTHTAKGKEGQEGNGSFKRPRAKIYYLSTDLNSLSDREKAQFCLSVL